MPTIITVVSWQFLSLMLLCPLYTQPNSDCFYIYPNVTGEVSWGGWSQNQDAINAVQHVALVILVSHFGNIFNITSNVLINL